MIIIAGIVLAIVLVAAAMVKLAGEQSEEGRRR